MTGEKDLDKLLKMMKPTLNVGDYVFCTTTNLDEVDLTKIISFF